MPKIEILMQNSMIVMNIKSKKLNFHAKIQDLNPKFHNLNTKKVSIYGRKLKIFQLWDHKIQNLDVRLTFLYLYVNCEFKDTKLTFGTVCEMLLPLVDLEFLSPRKYGRAIAHT